MLRIRARVIPPIKLSGNKMEFSVIEWYRNNIGSTHSHLYQRQNHVLTDSTNNARAKAFITRQTYLPAESILLIHTSFWTTCRDRWRALAKSSPEAILVLIRSTDTSSERSSSERSSRANFWGLWSWWGILRHGIHCFRRFLPLTSKTFVSFCKALYLWRSLTTMDKLSEDAETSRSRRRALFGQIFPILFESSSQSCPRALAKSSMSTKSHPRTSQRESWELVRAVAKEQTALCESSHNGESSGDITDSFSE